MRTKDQLWSMSQWSASFHMPNMADRSDTDSASKSLNFKNSRRTTLSVKSRFGVAVLFNSLNCIVSPIDWLSTSSMFAATTLNSKLYPWRLLLSTAVNLCLIAKSTLLVLKFTLAHFFLPSRQQPRSRRQLANRPKIEREAYLLHPGRSYGRLLNNLG